jgi:hypothetical protein
VTVTDELLAPEVPLSGEFDVEETVRAVPGDHRVKGMFFSRLSQHLGDGWRGIQSTLDQPPKYGRYVPFTDYPQRDYVRLCSAAAKKRFPALPLCESFDASLVATSTCLPNRWWAASCWRWWETRGAL